MIKRSIAVALLAFAGLVSAQDKPADLTGAQPNQAMYVREGDLWSKVMFVKREGSKYQIKYDDGTEEWVTADRLRLTAPAPGEKPAPPKAPAVKGAGFKVNDQVEMKERGNWVRVKILQRDGDWFMVDHVDSWKGWKLWAEPWRLRKSGLEYDFEGDAKGEGTIGSIGRPPRLTPGMPPGPTTGDNGSGIENKPEDTKQTALQVKLTEVKREGQEVLALASEWNYQVPASDAKTRIPAPAAPMILPGMSGGGQLDELRMHGRKGLICASASNWGESRQGFIKIDLGTNTATGISLESVCRARDISPSGNLVLAQSTGEMGGGKSILYILKITGSKAEAIMAFRPSPNEGDFVDAYFVDEQTILTLGVGELACWDISKAAQVWRTTASGFSIAVSPDSKTAAVGTRDGIALISIADGKTLGVIDADASGTGMLAFSGDGKNMMFLQPPIMEMWDLATGKSVSRFGIPLTIGGQLMPLSSEYFMIGNTLFSVAKKTPVWRYEGAGVQAYAGGRVFHSYNDGRRSVLTSAELPHARAKEVAKAVPDSIQVLKPGGSVSLVISVEADEATRKAITDNLTAQLAKANITVQENQPLKLVAKMGDTTSEQRSYHRFGMFGQDESVTITRQSTVLAFEFEGRTVWQTTSVSSNDPGFMVSLQRDESVQQAADKVQRSPAGWMSKARIPTSLAAPMDTDVMPSSVWLLGGVKDR